MKLFLSIYDILSEVVDSETNFITKKYEAWSLIDQTELSKFEQVGRIHIVPCSEPIIKSPIDYWSKNHPINFTHYPYHSCNVYTHKKSYFLVYQEFAGHASELRCRWIQKHLISDIT